MKTQGEIESIISDGMGRFLQEYMGQRPKNIRAYLLKDLLVVRLHGALNAAEQQLLQTSEKARGRDLLKQLRKELVETARPILRSLVTEITGLTVISLHHVSACTMTSAPSPAKRLSFSLLSKHHPSAHRGNDHGKAFWT
jgi:uncharacterized protein YbcI